MNNETTQTSHARYSQNLMRLLALGSLNYNYFAKTIFFYT